MLWFAVALAAGVASADTLAQPASALVAREAGAATFILHRQPAIPVVALRLAVLADDPAGYAGAGHLIQHLVFPTLRERVEQVGGRVQMQRTADALVYTAVGPATEVEYLADALRSALRLPQLRPTTLRLEQNTLREEQLAEWETADANVRARIRARLFPNELPGAGTNAALERLDDQAIREAWSGMYRPDRVSVTAVGDVSLAAVERAFAELPEPPSEQPDAARVDTVSAAPLAPAEATRGWFGIGYAAPDADPAALLVAGRLLRDDLRRRLPTSLVETEHWWTHDGQALVAIVATPSSAIAAAPRALGAAIPALRNEIDREQVRRAAAGIRREMLFYARTPEHMAELIGQFADRKGDADAAQEFFEQLQRVSVEDVQVVLSELAGRTPVRADVPPQKLKP